jgi:chromosome partitioning protein
VTDIVEQVNQNHGKDLKCGAVVNGFDPRPLHMGEIVRKINSDQHSGDFTVFETMISRSVRVMEAAEKAQSILEYAPGHKIAEQFRKLKKEYLRWV